MLYMETLHPFTISMLAIKSKGLAWSAALQLYGISVVSYNIYRIPRHINIFLFLWATSSCFNKADIC